MWKVDNNKCVSCTGCVAVCPFNSLTWEERKGVKVDDTCTFCGICQKFCPVGAINVEK